MRIIVRIMFSSVSSMIMPGVAQFMRLLASVCVCLTSVVLSRVCVCLLASMCVCVCVRLFTSRVPNACVCVRLFTSRVPNACVCVRLFTSRVPNVCVCSRLCASASVCVCMRLCASVCVCSRLCASASACECSRLYASMCVCVCLRMLASVCVCVCVRLRLCASASVCVCSRLYASARVCVRLLAGTGSFYASACVGRLVSRLLASVCVCLRELAHFVRLSHVGRHSKSSKVGGTGSGFCYLSRVCVRLLAGTGSFYASVVIQRVQRWGELAQVFAICLASYYPLVVFYNVLMLKYPSHHLIYIFYHPMPIMPLY